MKTKEEILDQLYISPRDLKLLIPAMGRQSCLKLIKDIREEMEMKKMFVPKSRPLLAQTKMVRKRLGIWKQKNTPKTFLTKL